ncbi:GAF domain-containing protein [Massilia sp. UBA6681]|uniref:GAF domain-containing protein n=1 Tax=Massilia sp. UBA6681 TaxID=1946839 RepID=UPI0025C399F7|nr:GAF domain-containing protein [Massilia sp. UBA6681]
MREESMQAVSLPLIRLQALQQALAQGPEQASLQDQVRRAAGVIGAASCSVMLLGSEGEGEPCMSIHAHHGPLPGAALQAAIRRGEGISGRVLASGNALLVADIRKSEFAALARRGTELGSSLVCAPIRVEGRIVGVVNAANGKDAAAFDETALCLLQLLASSLGGYLQVRHLRHLLDSRFAQLALLQETEGAPPETARLAYRNPEQVARILARSFFREMHRAGFGSAQILSAASELIGQLNHDIQQEQQGH